MGPSRRTNRQLLTVAVLLTALGSHAQPISLVPNTVNMFRDTRGANDVGFTPGDRFQYGANIVGGALGTSLGATYAPTGFAVTPSACAPAVVSPNLCSRSVSFNAGRLGPWTFNFTRGSDSLNVLGPSLAGAEQTVPFPVSVTLSGSGVTPTVSWSVPNGFAPDAFRVNVMDKNRVLADRTADVVHSVGIAANSTSYTLPSTFSSGLGLQVGGNYTINLQLIETRGHVVFTNDNSEILRRSSSFFAFTPLTGSNPPNVALPTVDNGVYNFNVGAVGPSSITFIDPFVAVGYDYAIGEGNPNFASVLLPDVGDGEYTLEFTGSDGAQSVDLESGTQYFFGGRGVSAFKVRGIETSAMLDPENVTAFITGLTFSANGAFTGTMTPVTEFVSGIPEPSTYALMALGLLGIGFASRRKRA